MFHFSLQTVLEVRERFEKIKYKEYSQELLVKQQLEQERSERESSLTRAGKHADRIRTKTVTAMPLQMHDAYRRRLREEIDVFQSRLRDQEEAAEEKRKELVEARRSHRALEILRDKEYRRYRKNAAKLERAVMDEVATNYFIFKP